MKLETRFAGLRLREHKLTISERQCVNYAAGIGDDNPLLINDEQPGGLLAHPVLATAITWQVTRRLWEFLPAGDFPVHLLVTQVHYSEYLEFHQPLRPGMDLTLQCNIAAILPHRAGTQVVLCFEATGPGGERVFTEHIGGLLRGVACDGPPAGEEILPSLPPLVESDREPNWTETITLPALAPYIYDACADIHFPIHTSPRFAHQAGLPGIIVQGTQVLARALSVILERQTGGDPRSLSALTCRFAGMVIPGENLTLRVWENQGSIHAKNLYFDLHRAEGGPAIRSGYCRFVNLDAIREDLL